MHNLGILSQQKATPLTFSYVGVSTSSDANITVISGIRQYDIIIIVTQGRNVVSPPSAVLPSGFTNYLDFTDTNTRGSLDMKIADGSESSVVLTGIDATVDTKTLIVIRPNKPISAIGVGSVNSQFAGASAPTNQNVIVGASPLVVLAGAGADTSVGPTFSPVAADASVGSATLQIAYKIFNTGAVNTTVSEIDGGASNMLLSCYLYAVPL